MGVGLFVGVTVGVAVGLGDGLFVGTEVGVGVARGVDVACGVAVGSALADGSALGVAVGVDVGGAVGEGWPTGVGDAPGRVGSDVAVCVGNGVGEGGAVGATVAVGVTFGAGVLGPGVGEPPVRFWAGTAPRGLSPAPPLQALTATQVAAKNAIAGSLLRIERITFPRSANRGTGASDARYTLPFSKWPSSYLGVSS